MRQKRANAMMGSHLGGGMGGGGMGGAGPMGGMSNFGNPSAMAPPPPAAPQSAPPGGGMGGLPPPPAGVGSSPGGGGGSMGGPKMAAYRFGQRLALQEIEKQATPASVLGTALRHGAVSALPGAALGGAMGAYNADPGERGQGALRGAAKGGLITGGLGALGSGAMQFGFRSGGKHWSGLLDPEREKFVQGLVSEGLPVTEGGIGKYYGSKNWLQGVKALNLHNS